MDRLVIFTNLKFNYFTHFNGPLQSTEQNHRPSASIAQVGCLRDLPVLCNDLTLISLLWTNIADRLHYLIGELFPKYQSGAKHTRLIMVGLRQLLAMMACSIAYIGPTIPTPTVCDSVSWVVEVSKGYQPIHILLCPRQRGITI